MLVGLWDECKGGLSAVIVHGIGTQPLHWVNTNEGAIVMAML
jgi:hypothetical protein